MQRLPCHARTKNEKALLSGVELDNGDVVPRHPVRQLPQSLVSQLKSQRESYNQTMNFVTCSGVPKYLSVIQAIAVVAWGGGSASSFPLLPLSSSSTSRPLREPPLSLPFSVFSGNSKVKLKMIGVG